MLQVSLYYSTGLGGVNSITSQPFASEPWWVATPCGGEVLHFMFYISCTKHPTPGRTSPPMQLFVCVSRETPDVMTCHTSPPQGVPHTLAYAPDLMTRSSRSALHPRMPRSLRQSLHLGISSQSMGCANVSLVVVSSTRTRLSLFPWKPWLALFDLCVKVAGAVSTSNS